MTRESIRNSLLSLIVLTSFAAMTTAAHAAPVSFAKAIVYPSGASWVYGVAVADLNGDNHPDIVVVDLCGVYSCYSAGPPAIGKIGVLLNNGDGTFQPAVVYDSGGYNSYAVAVGDVNGDGKPDVVITNTCETSDCSGGSISILPGRGDGTFQSPVSYSSGENAYSVAIGDVNRDGIPDIVVGTCIASYSGCSDGKLAVLLGTGHGSFQPAVTYDSGGSGAWSVALADVNRDGKLDIVVANWAGAGVLLGNGDGTFQPAVVYDSGSANAYALAVGDVNGDKKLDLVLTHVGGRTVGVLLGNGDGTFQAPTMYEAGPAPLSVAISDVNGDGRLDLAVASGSGSNGYVDVLVGNGDGSFQAPVVYSSGSVSGPADAIAMADVNGDGRPDAVVGNWGVDTVGVLRNNFSVKTATILTSSLNPSLINQPVTFTATVTSNPPLPAGQSVTFYDGTTVLATVGLVGGTATYQTSSLSVKTHGIKAKYAGTPTYKPSAGFLAQVVNRYSTSTSLASSPNPSTYGESVTFKATVVTGGPTPLTGNVKFMDGPNWLGAVPLSNGVAILHKSSLDVGAHSITAQYLGDPANAKSTSSAVNQVVQ